MAELVTNGAELMCTFGIAPATLVVLPEHRVMVNEEPAATIEDSAPMMNIATFGMCTSPANPEVMAATAAALGVLTPMPCVPATSDPWIPGVPTVSIGGMPAVDETCTCMCMWGGEISVTFPGQATVTAS